MLKVESSTPRPRPEYPYLARLDYPGSGIRLVLVMESGMQDLQGGPGACWDKRGREVWELESPNALIPLPPTEVVTLSNKW